MKRTLALLGMAAALAFGDAPGSAPAVTPAGGTARQLYDIGMRQTQAGELAAARLTLQSLAERYPRDPLALEAKGAIDATLLFEEGTARAKAGKYETAQLAFETLIAVYPENPLAPPAKTELAAIAEKAGKSRPVVKAMEFRDVEAVPVEEIRAGLEQREVRLSVGKPYRARDLEQARTALAEILAEKGMAKARVQVQTRTVPPHSVDVIFTVEKPRASLLRSPWRLATLAWLRHGSAEKD
jgi:tetratricopeptide (TPR) repeat protein